VAGALTGALLALGVDPVLRIPPSTWKGRTPKDLHHPVILASLSDRERTLIPRGPRSGRYQPDALDAVGMALWAVGRLGNLQADPADFASLVEPAPARGRTRRQGGG